MNLCTQLQSVRDTLNDSEGLYDCAWNLMRSAALKSLPVPGSGATRVRYAALSQIGRCDVALARVLEAHLDAVAILAEAGREAATDALYGVWAARHPQQPLQAVRRDGGWQVQGTVPFCTGARYVDRSLIAAEASDGRVLFEVGAGQFGDMDDSQWLSPGMSRAPAAEIRFDQLLPASALIGETGFYLDRRGFWPGAIGVAACWLGGAMGLLDTWIGRGTRADQDAHAFAHLGTSFAAVDCALQALNHSADLVDDPELPPSLLRLEALLVRHEVEQACTTTLARMGRAVGPRLFVADRDTALRQADLNIYIRQCHAERDLEALGRQLHAEFQDRDFLRGFAAWR